MRPISMSSEQRSASSARPITRSSSPNRLVLETDAGEVIEVRDNPRGAFAGHTNETPWDRLHAAYFHAYAVWTYLTQPFLYTYPGFTVDEVEP